MRIHGVSVSKWVKLHRDRLKRVQLHSPMTTDQRWRKYRQAVEWRRLVKQRDRHRCTVCGGRGDLQVHHIIPATVCSALRFEVWNGLTLCERCHARDDVHRLDPEFWRKMIRG